MTRASQTRSGGERRCAAARSTDDSKILFWSNRIPNNQQHQERAEAGVHPGAIGISRVFLSWRVPLKEVGLFTMSLSSAVTRLVMSGTVRWHRRCRSSWSHGVGPRRRFSGTQVDRLRRSWSTSRAEEASVDVYLRFVFVCVLLGPIVTEVFLSYVSCLQEAENSFVSVFIFDDCMPYSRPLH